MNERDDQSIDHELSGVAMAATHEHEQTVSANETEAALEAVRSRIAGGDLGGAPPSIPLSSSSASRRSPWVRLGAIAAVLAMFALGLVAVVGGGETNDVITPVTVPSTADPVTAPPSIAITTTPSSAITTTPSPETTTSETTTTAAEVTTTSVVPDPVVSNAIVQPTAVERTCVAESTGCTELASTEDGRIVAFDPGTSRFPGSTRFRVYNADGTELQREVLVTEPIADLVPFLLHVGPDDVAYVNVDDPDIDDPIGRILAIPLVGDTAGTVVKDLGETPRVGDNVLIARKTGLTNVPCCGPRVTRPSPDATIYRWVDRNGELIESAAPSFDLNLGDAGNSLTRIDTAADGSAMFTRFTLPTAFQYPRDFLRVAPTGDGGALAYDSGQLGAALTRVFVDFDTDWPAGSVDNGDVYYTPIGDVSGNPTLEPSGTVIVVADGAFVRRTLDEVATRGWPGRTEIDIETGTLTASGLNEYIAAEQPYWAQGAGQFALQLVQSVGPNEQVAIDFGDLDAPTITITTTGLLDDSADETRVLVTTERADDGLLRFVSATFGFRCVAGRGHQDFSTEPCS